MTMYCIVTRDQNPVCSNQKLQPSYGNTRRLYTCPTAVVRLQKTASANPSGIPCGKPWFGNYVLTPRFALLNKKCFSIVYLQQKTKTKVLL